MFFAVGRGVFFFLACSFRVIGVFVILVLVACLCPFRFVAPVCRVEWAGRFLLFACACVCVFLFSLVSWWCCAVDGLWLLSVCRLCVVSCGVFVLDLFSCFLRGLLVVSCFVLVVCAVFFFALVVCVVVYSRVNRILEM